MSSRLSFKTTFDIEKVIQPIYTGGSVALDDSGRVLVTTLGEDALLTDLETGEHLVRIFGVSSYLFSRCAYFKLIDWEIGRGGHYFFVQYV